MSTRIRLILWGVLVAVIAAGGYLYWQWRSVQVTVAETVSIRQEVVGRGDIVSTVSATGFLAPETQANLFFATATRSPVLEVNVVTGQAVKKGDVLGRFDTADLEISISQAEQSVKAAQVTLQQLQSPPRPADLAVAQANIKLAQNRVYLAAEGAPTETVQLAYLNLLMARNTMDATHQKMDQLVKQGKFADKNALQAQADQQVQDTKVADQRYQEALKAAPAGRIVSAQAGVDQAKAALDKLQNGARPEDIKVAQLQIDQAQTAVDLAKNNLADAQLVAPFDGVVGAVNLKVGEPPPPNLPAVVLVDASRFHLDIAVDEVDVARIKPGQAVSVTLDAMPDLQLTSTVDRIAPTSTVNQGVVSYQVRLALAATPDPVRAGMTATGVIVVDQARNVVLAPNWAIRRDRVTGQSYAAILKDGKIAEVPVALGLKNESYSEVKSGLSAGDIVAVDTAHQQLSLLGPSQ